MTALTELLAMIDIRSLIEWHEDKAARCSARGSHNYALRHRETASVLRAMIDEGIA